MSESIHDIPLKCCKCGKNDVERTFQYCEECEKLRIPPVESKAPHKRMSEEEWGRSKTINFDREKASTINRKQLEIMEQCGHFENRKLAADMKMTPQQYKEYMHNKMVKSRKKDRYYTAKDFDMERDREIKGVF